jgi:CHAT domain-containing protein
MLSILIATLLFLNSQISRDVAVNGDSHTQVTSFLQAILDESNPEVNFWYLAQMAFSDSVVDSAISARLSAVHQSGSPTIDNCWLTAFSSARMNMGAQGTLITRLSSANKCSKNGDLILSALYETSRSKRKDFYNSNKSLFEGQSVQNPIFKAHLEKALDNPYDQNLLFDIRKFALADAYLFDGYSQHTDRIHNPLISSWDRQIQDKNRISDPLDFIKINTIITFMHLFDDNFTGVYTFVPLLKNNPNYPNSIHKHRTFKRLMFAATIQGYYQTALKFYREDLLPLSSTIMPLEEFYIVVIDYGSILFRLGDVKSALTTYQRVYENIDKIKSQSYRGALLNNLAVSYLDSGYFDQYVKLQIEAYELAKSAGQFRSQFQILYNLSIYHSRNSDWSNAFLYMNQALELAIEMNGQVEIANIYTTFALYYRERENDFSQSMAMLNRALNLIDTENDYRIHINILTETIRTYDRFGYRKEALELRYAIKNLAEQRNDDRVSLEANAEIATYYLNLGDIDRSKSIIELLRASDAREMDFRVRVKTINAIASYKWQTDEKESALTILREISSDIISSVKSSADLQSGLLRLEEFYNHSFNLTITYLMELGHDYEAIVWLDEIKNLNKSAFVNSSLLKSSMLSEEDFLRDVQLSNQIDFIRRQTQQATQQEKIALNNQLLQLLNDKNAINNKILTSYTNETLNISQLQNSIRRTDQILAFTSIDSIMYVTSISRGNYSIEKSVISLENRDHIEKTISNLISANANLHHLHEIYVRYIGAHINTDAKRILFVPDDFFYQIPIEILPQNRTANSYNYGSARYLIEDYTISYQNSLSDILAIPQNRYNRQTTLDYLGIGISDFKNIRPISSQNYELSSLPYAKIEIEQSASILTEFKNKAIFIDSDGNRGNFLSNAASSKILHIASHSEVYLNDPLFSVIYLNENSGNEKSRQRGGNVYAHELFDLNILSELIILSSCESGGGTYLQGSGIIGLGRALNFAGARSLVMNMWSIRDQTASELTKSFLTHLNDGVPRDEALRRAKVTYLNTKDSNPAVWGSLILFGDYEAIQTGSYSKERMYFITFLLVLSLILVFYRRYRR